MHSTHLGTYGLIRIATLLSADYSALVRGKLYEIDTHGLTASDLDDQARLEAYARKTCKEALKIRGTTLKELRQSHHLSRSEIANIIGVSESAFKKWELGVDDIQSLHADSLAAYFKVPVEDILYPISQ